MISLCIISRKEDDGQLNAALHSCYTFVDEIIIVDTSTDKPITLTIGARETGAKIIPFKWTGSFADARNFSFEQATGDVIFWIDSDDIVTNPENIPKLAQQITDGKVDWIVCEYVYQRDESGNILAKHWKHRFFRKGTVKWVGNVHEDPQQTQIVSARKDTDLGFPISVEHTASLAHLEESAKRNLKIQLDEIEKDGEHVDPRTIQYTALSYQGLNQYEQAIPYFLQHIKVTGSKEDKFWSLYRASMCFYFLGRLEEALNLALDSLKLFPEWKSSYFLIATIYNELEDWQKVIEWTLTGIEKEYPETLQVTSDLDYTILPMGRLAMAYLQTNNYALANETAADVYKMNPKYPGSIELVRMCMEATKLEGFTKSFLEVVENIKRYDRVKATKLFDLIPKELDDDRRIQHARTMTVAPKKWDEKSVVIYCGSSLETWSYPSVFTGIGGSEEAVIYLSRELVNQGYHVTVYNRCGDMKGVFEGVEYLPYYYFNPRDIFDTLVIWRNPLVLTEKFTANHVYLWMHDIAHPEHFNQDIYDHVDKILFLSKWHTTNLPECPKDKIFVTNNGINPDDFKDLPPKNPNSLVYTASYDRGALTLLRDIFPLVRKEIPDATLDIAYGLGNIEKEMEILPHLKELRDEIVPLLENTPGVTHHGRVSHKKIAKLLGSSMVYTYPTEFGETCCISSMKAQEADTYVLTTTNSGGTPERLRYGKAMPIDHIYTDKEGQVKFAKEIVKLLKNLPANTADLSEFYWSFTAKDWIDRLLL